MPYLLFGDPFAEKTVYSEVKTRCHLSCGSDGNNILIDTFKAT